MSNMESKIDFFSNSFRKFIDHSTLPMNHYKKRLMANNCREHSSRLYRNEIISLAV
ncbi:MAG: hypothetical protein KBF99_04765 [Leptospiraceae bacterium]|nr:hypothetical protein [Leptospiraceae bacterium]MBK7056715.1 hypothetical protein [Leptospiraceae bacterium]MBL0262963.1 hypothetical protein [Leptospiraceae bacterium]MBP9162469.1 hypothetical protein [Leptospiraceae bacterium]